jgi:hypothetical protein
MTAPHLLFFNWPVSGKKVPLPMSLQILKSAFRPSMVPGLRAASKDAWRKLAPNAPLKGISADIFQQIKSQGGRSKLDWDSKAQSPYIRVTLKNGQKLDRIHFPQQTKNKAEFDSAVSNLQGKLSDALKQGDALNKAGQTKVSSPQPTPTAETPKATPINPQTSLGVRGKETLSFLKSDPELATHYKAVYQQSSAVFIGWADRLLREAALTHDPHVLFLARNGSGGLEAAKQLVTKFPHRYPGVTQDSLHYVYLNPNTVGTATEPSYLLKEYLKQEAHLSPNSSVFLANMGWSGSQANQFAKIFKGELGQFKGLHLMFSNSNKQSAFVHPYIDLTSPTSPLGTLSNSSGAGVRLMESTFSGTEGRAKALYYDPTSYTIKPNITPLPMTPKEKVQRDWALAALADASGDITEAQLNALTTKTASDKLHGFLNKSAPQTPAANTAMPLNGNGVTHAQQPVQVTHGTPPTAIVGQTADEFGIPFKPPTTNFVKTTPALTPEAKTLKEMHRQLDMVTARVINEQVLNSVSHTQQDKARILLNNMTQFSNMESVSKLYSLLNTEVKRKAAGYGGGYSFHPDYPIYVTRDDSLAGILSYIGRKQKNTGHFRASTFTTNDIMGATRGSILIDKNVLQQLESDPALLQHIKQNDFKLLYPDGFDEGINFLDLATPKAFQKKLNAMLDLAHSRPELPLDWLNSYRTLQRINGLGLGSQGRFTWLRNPDKFVQPNANVPIPTAEKIASNLAPIKMSRQQFKTLLDGCPKRGNYSQADYREAVMELIQHDAHFFSPQRLANLAKAKQSWILQTARNKGVEPDKIIYYIPEKGKSYSMVAMQHTYVNNIHPSQIVTDVNKIPKNDKNMVVILDDVAGSGDSLRTAYNRLRSYGNYKGPVLISPTVSTTNAKKVIEKLSGNVQYLPSKIIPSFRDSHFYKKATPSKQALYAQIMDAFGYNQNGLSVVFPYMSPDNCNYFFAHNIAPRYLMNGQGAKNASKKYNGPIKQAPSIKLQLNPLQHTSVYSPTLAGIPQWYGY